MELMKADLKNKISRFTERRKAFKAKSHPYTSKRNRVTSSTKTCGVLPSSLNGNDGELSLFPRPDAQLDGIKLQCNRPFTGIDISNSITTPQTSTVGTSDLSSLESDSQVGSISSVSPLPCSSKPADVKDSTTPDVSANQHEESSLTGTLKRVISLRSSTRKLKKDKGGQDPTPSLHLKRASSLRDSRDYTPFKRRGALTSKKSDTELLNKHTESCRENATSNGLFQKFRRRAGKSKLFSSFKGRNDHPVSSLQIVSETASLTNQHSDATPDVEVMAVVNTNHDSTHTNSLQAKGFLDAMNIQTPKPSNHHSDVCNTGFIVPPTPFRVLVTPSETEDHTEDEPGNTRTISKDLRREIEKSLLHWPTSTTDKGEYSMKSLTRSNRSSRVIQDSRSPTSQSLTLPNRTSRPLSWSCDTLDSREDTQAKVSYSNYSVSDYQTTLTTTSVSVSNYSPTPASSCSTLTSDSVLMDMNASYDTLASEEFGDAVTALRKFEVKCTSYKRDTRRMSQPHLIKLRSRLPSEDSVQSLQLPPVTRSHRGRSRSEPPRLVHDDIRRSFHTDLSKLCPGVGDIAYPSDARMNKQLTHGNIRVADPLWHHVTNEPDELSFHVGDVIMVLDISDKDWWWGRKTGSPSSTSLAEAEAMEQLSGWFPSTFVRLRANQDITTDELLEDMKQGTLDTASVVQHYQNTLLSRDQARCNVVNEIITAERDYVQHLRDIVEGFIDKCKEREDMFTELQIQLIFGNVADIYDMARAFLDKLELCVSRCESVHLATIGRCFLEHKQDFEIYSAYCNNHPRGLRQLQQLKNDSKYIHFFEACRLLQNMIELPLDGFLLTPIQKICKYPLQLAELLKYTHTTHGDYDSLQQALHSMKDMAMLINERKRKLESIQKVMEWQGTVDDWQGEDMLTHSSELIHSGELSKLSSAGRLTDRHFFLFDHQLIQCKKELLKKCLIYKSRINLDTHSVVSVKDGKAHTSSINVKNAFEVRNEDGVAVLSLCAKTSSEKEKWLKCFGKERQIVQKDRESGFVVTEALKGLAELSINQKSSKPHKLNSSKYNGGSKHMPFVYDSKDRANNNKPMSKQKSIINKLKRARVVT